MSWLAYLRGAVGRNIAGLTDEEARWTPGATLISVLGVVNHLTKVEWRWIDGGMLGEAVSRRDDEFTPGPELTIAAALKAYRDRAQRTEADRPLALARRALPPRGGHEPALGSPPPHQRDRAPRRPRRRDPRAARRHEGRVMATQADVRRIALALPGAIEDDDRFAFSVRVKNKDKGFAWVWLERIHPKKGRVPQPKVLAVRVADEGEKFTLVAVGRREVLHRAALQRLSRGTDPVGRDPRAGAAGADHRRVAVHGAA